MLQENGSGRAVAASGAVPLPRRAPVITVEEGAVPRWGPALLAVFFASLMIPGGFTVAGLFLNPYRVVLIVAFVPLFLRWISGRAGPLAAGDWGILLYCVWIWIALFALHGMERVHTAGIQFAEMFGGYLIGRTLVRDSASFRTFVRYLFLAVLFVLPLGIVELLTGWSPLRTIFSPFMIVQDRAWIGFTPRLGFNERAQGPFPHPILMGLFCSLAVANVFFLLRGRIVRQMGALGLVLLAVLVTLSSAPLISAGLQLMMIAWDRVLCFLRARWIILAALGVTIVLVFQLAWEGGIVGFVIETLTFNPVTGEYRLDILHFGLLSVANNPLFGIGFNDWERGFWMEHPTMDNFWLVVAVQYGLPGLVLIVSGIVLNVLRSLRNSELDAEAAALRSGYLFALAGLVVVLGTVTLWGAVSTFVLTYLGAGIWFGDRKREAERPVRRSAGPAPRAPEPAPPGARPGPLLGRGPIRGPVAGGRRRPLPERTRLPRHPRER